MISKDSKRILLKVSSSLLKNLKNKASKSKLKTKVSSRNKEFKDGIRLRLSQIVGSCEPLKPVLLKYMDVVLENLTFKLDV